MLRSDIKVLIIEDVNAMRVQIKDLLHNMGIRQVQLANNGPSAVSMLKSDKFHLILCDMHLDPVSGLDILKEIRGNSETQNTAFVMITADTTQPSVLEAIKAGTDSYLAKPFSAQDFENKIVEVLGRRKILA